MYWKQLMMPSRVETASKDGRFFSCKFQLEIMFWIYSDLALSPTARPGQVTTTLTREHDLIASFQDLDKMFDTDEECDTDSVNIMQPYKFLLDIFDRYVECTRERLSTESSIFQNQFPDSTAPILPVSPISCLITKKPACLLFID